MREHTSDETGLVAAAAKGDAAAFSRLIGPIRRDLHLLCYRMMGSYHDAEDVLQDAQLKAWRGIESYDGRASFGTWMFSVTTNACLDALTSRKPKWLIGTCVRGKPGTSMRSWGC